MEIDNYITGILDSTVHPDCLNCGQIILNDKRAGRTPRVYCDLACFREWRAMGQAETHYCELCGDECSFGSRSCGICHDSRISDLFNMNEIVELVLLNKSCGLDYFVQNVWGGRRNLRVRLVLHEFLTVLSEFEGFDYIEYLEDPSGMDKVLVSEYEDRIILSKGQPNYDDRTRYIRGQTRSTVSRGVQRKNIREGGETRGSHLQAKLPPKFNWGRFENRITVILLKKVPTFRKTELTPAED